MPPDDDEGLWVRSDVDPFGRYRPVVTYGGDRSWVLHKPAAYATDVMQVVATAEHDAAIVRTLRGVTGMDNRGIATALLEVRKDRATEIHALTGLSLTPICTPDGRAVVVIKVDGCAPGQTTSEQMRQHAIAALMVAAVAKLDQHLYDTMRDTFDLGEGARDVVESLADHWPNRS